MPDNLLAIIGLVCIGAVLYRYGQQGRWQGAAGWSLVILSISSFGTGAATGFAWAGLAFVSLGGIGAILVTQDLVEHRKGRGRSGHRPSD